MAKKLKVELEVDDTKARRKLGAMGDTGGNAAGGVDTAAERMARTMDKASRSVQGLGESAGKTHVNMKEAIRAFGGLGIGLAAQYSAKYLDEGSGARKAVEYGAGALQGASIGMMAGPWGAAAGAGLGVLKTYFDKSGEQKQALKDFETSERRFAEAKDWAARFEGMTGRADMEAELDRLKSAETVIAQSVRAFASKGELSNANHQIESLGQNRQRQAQLEAAIKGDEKTHDAEQRTSTTAIDALSRVGGAFAGAGAGDGLLRANLEQVSLLRSIERKTGAALWG